MRRMLSDNSGSILPIFAICSVVVFAAVGAALDYSRAASARTEMQASLDAAAIMLAKEASGLSAGELAARAQMYFNANFTGRVSGTITVVPTVQTSASGVNTIKVEGTGTLDTTVSRVFGTPTMTIRTSSEVTWGMKRLELALALDNTGSMNEVGKITALKEAVNNLLDTLEKTSKVKGDIKVAIVPFTTFVNVDKAKSFKKWVDLTDWTENDSVGSESGTTSVWYNKKTGNKWTGCVMDRAQPLDTQDTAPTSSISTQFPAADCTNPVPVQALTSNWKQLHKKVDSMVADGTTNVTIGMVWGWHALTPDLPLPEGTAAASDLDKVLILLTDGENTENRWTTSSTAIDQRTSTVCDNIKAQKIKLYTVRVIEGNAALLRNCATAPNMYFEVTAAAQLDSVFKSIADSLATLRLSK